MKAAFSRVFTLEVDGRPTLSFEASGTREAQQLCKEPWLLDDLSTFTSGGVRLRESVSALSVRPASPYEASFFSLVASRKDEPPDDMVIAYLVDLDDQEDRP